jgi:hypothetical protein
VRLLEELVTAIQAKGEVWFARGREIAAHYRAHPEARREIDFDHPQLQTNPSCLSSTNRKSAPHVSSTSG